MNHRMSDEKFTQGDLAMECGQNFDANGKFVGVQEWGLFGAFCTAHSNVVEVRGQRRQTKIQSDDCGPAAGGKVGLLHDLAQRVLLKAVAAQIEVSRNRGDEEQRPKSG